MYPHLVSSSNCSPPLLFDVLLFFCRRGFLVADVMTFYDLIELGSERKVRRVGKMRQQGKRYIINDCDVVYFQYNKMLNRE